MKTACRGHRRAENAGPKHVVAGNNLGVACSDWLSDLRLFQQLLWG